VAPTLGRPPLRRPTGPLGSYSSPSSRGSNINRHTCLQCTQPSHYRPQAAINSTLSLTCNTHQRSFLFSYSLYRVGLVVWASRACLGISESSSEVWYSSCIFSFDINISYFFFYLFKSALLSAFTYLYKLSCLCAEVTSLS